MTRTTLLFTVSVALLLLAAVLLLMGLDPVTEELVKQHRARIFEG